MVSFIDFHCHIDFYENTDEIIKNARESNVNIILNNGINREANRKTIALSKKYSEVKACLGLYPIEALKLTDKEIDEEINFIKKQNITAIGEVGMDFAHSQEKEKQKNIFRKFIKLSKELDKPIIVHSRKAELECIELLEEEKAKKVVMHCFTGKKKLIERIEKNNWFLTIPTMVVYSEQTQEFVKMISISQLLCETDSPYLHPERKDDNEPANVVEAYKKVAEIKNMTLEEVKNVIFMNWQKLI